MKTYDRTLHKMIKLIQHSYIKRLYIQEAWALGMPRVVDNKMLLMRSAARIALESSNKTPNRDGNGINLTAFF